MGLNSWIVGRPSLALPLATNEVCDLLIKGGTIIDPVRNIHAPLDIAIKNGTILEILPDIPKSRARNILSAEGRFVTPGLNRLREANFVFVDSVGETRNGRHKLISSATIRNGEIYVNQ